jgi:hypothetical protein
MSSYIILLQAFPTANLPRYLWKLVWHLRGVNSSQFQNTCSTQLSRFLQVLAYWILLAFLFKQQIRLVSIYLWPQCSYGSSVFFPFSFNVLKLSNVFHIFWLDGFSVFPPSNFEAPRVPVSFGERMRSRWTYVGCCRAPPATRM